MRKAGAGRRRQFLAEIDSKTQWGQQPAAELWRRTLSRVPTVFGRLVYLAALRDGTTGRYAHPALLQTLGPEDTDRILRHSHHQVFSQWLTYSLADQKSDLDDFFREYDAPRHAFRYRDLTPPNARDVERQLYVTDLETLLELLEFERSGVGPAQGA